MNNCSLKIKSVKTQTGENSWLEENTRTNSRSSWRLTETSAGGKQDYAGKSRGQAGLRWQIEFRRNMQLHPHWQASPHGMSRHAGLQHTQRAQVHTNKE